MYKLTLPDNKNYMLNMDQQTGKEIQKTLDSILMIIKLLNNKITIISTSSNTLIIRFNYYNNYKKSLHMVFHQYKYEFDRFTYACYSKHKKECSNNTKNIKKIPKLLKEIYNEVKG